ncbi:MAG: hypothetical protein KDK37_14495 [Leptospiraceae bacterium]|nr:hypothetical protein [Leptospiraceae bacterium]MCB1305492.1 hypothetical protein [Leptospiraceae bacterium]
MSGLGTEFYIVVAAACVFTSVLSAILTGFGFYYYYQSRLANRLEKELDEYAEIVKTKLKEGVEEAGESLLPRFKQETRAGFREAITDALSGQMVDETVRAMTKTGSTLVESSLNLLLGRKESEHREHRPGQPDGPGVSRE